MIRFVFTLTLVFSTHSNAFAYGIPNHRNLSERAILEFNRCNQKTHIGKVTSEEASWIISGNLSEDYNLITKTLRWHFYNPNKTLAHRVLDKIGISRTIVPYYTRKVFQVREQLDPDEHPNHRQKDPNDRKNLYGFLGNLIHFLQDMTCPPHIIPIFHTSSDNFDNYPLVHEFTSLQRDRLDCTHVRKVLNDFSSKDPLDLIQNLYLKTSQVIQNPIVDENGLPAVYKNGKPYPTTWEGFWTGLDYPAFGQYGEFGNEFGNSHFPRWNLSKYFLSSANTYFLDQKYYHEFAKKQHRDALDATLRAIYWLKASINKIEMSRNHVPKE